MTKPCFYHSWRILNEYNDECEVDSHVFIKIDTSFRDGSDVFWQGLVENAPLDGPLL